MDLHRTDYVAVLDLINFCHETVNSNDVDQVTRRLQQLIPFNSAVIAYGRIRNGRVESVQGLYSHGHNPWLDEYLEHRFDRIDPVVMRALHDAKPFCWHEAFNTHPCHDERYLTLKRSFGLRDGIAAAYHSRRDRTRLTLVSLSTSDPAIPSRYLTILGYVLPHLHEAFVRTPDQTVEPSSPPLTGREIEILKWIKEGKSSWDISTLMSISERTVKFHVSNLFAKLDVCNRAQAVARAMRLGVLDL